MNVCVRCCLYGCVIFVRTKSRLIVCVELAKQLEELCRHFISVLLFSTGIVVVSACE